MEGVSSGAVGEFRKVVDSATTEYNDNHNLKLAKYNANASEKLTTYDTNAEQHTTDYNRNAEQKLEAYNSNHTEKVAEYNQNAETKTAEFDANADALQTEVDRLRGECDQLAAENRKQENRISALIKLNKSDYDFMLSRVSGKKSGHGNLLCQRYNLDSNEIWMQGSDGVYGGNTQNNIIYIKDLNFTEPLTFKEAMKGVSLIFELETPTTEPFTIPEALQEWLPVEAGGTVAFRNSDESKQLAVPNAVSWVRELDEVE